MTATKASIVIATYRRPEMLRDSVLSLRSMKIPSDVSLEVLIIDNDPECSADRVMKELAVLCAGIFDLRYIAELRTGLSHARNRGIEEAHGDVIAFLDDDIFISDHWLVAMLECLRRTGAASVGGRIVNCWEGEPDPAVRGCEGGLNTHDWGDRDFALRGRMLPGGGNSAFRRDVFSGGLRFSTELGRVGNILLSGEDTELFKRLQKQGHSVWYCAGGLMHHRVGGERLTQDYLIHRNFWFGYSYSIIDRRLEGTLIRIGHALGRLGKLLLIDIGRLALAALQRDGAGKLMARCSIARQAGYLRATLFPPLGTRNLAPQPISPVANSKPNEATTAPS